MTAVDFKMTGRGNENSCGWDMGAIPGRTGDTGLMQAAGYRAEKFPKMEDVPATGRKTVQTSCVFCALWCLGTASDLVEFPVRYPRKPVSALCPRFAPVWLPVSQPQGFSFPLPAVLKSTAVMPRLPARGWREDG